MSCCGDAGVLVWWCHGVGIVVAWLLVALRKREKQRKRTREREREIVKK